MPSDCTGDKAGTLGKKKQNKFFLYTVIPDEM